MSSMNAQVNPQALQKTLQNFEMESAKMDMKEEMCKYSVRTVQCITLVVVGSFAVYFIRSFFRKLSLLSLVLIVV